MAKILVSFVADTKMSEGDVEKAFTDHCQKDWILREMKISQIRVKMVDPLDSR